MTSDFFLKEADEWREEAWRIIKARSDVIFILITKRAEKASASEHSRRDETQYSWKRQ